jgi:hypothetical protein
VVAALAPSGPAQAAPAVSTPVVFSDQVIFRGHASVTPPVPLVGGSGTFTVDSTANCLLLSDGSVEGVPAEGPWACTVTASGTYTSTVCGTGSANITYTVTSPDGTLSGIATIPFVGGIGILGGTVHEHDNDDNSTYDATLLAETSLQRDGSTPPGACTSGFNIVTTAAISEDPLAP